MGSESVELEDHEKDQLSADVGSGRERVRTVFESVEVTLPALLGTSAKVVRVSLPRQEECLTLTTIQQFLPEHRCTLAFIQLYTDFYSDDSYTSLHSPFVCQDEKTQSPRHGKHFYFFLLFNFTF